MSLDDKNFDYLPKAPSYLYKDKGWISLGDFFGTYIIACANRVYLEFEEARVFVRKLKIKSIKEWRDYCKSGERPNNIPATPDNIYRNDGWISFGDWLGTGFVHKKIFLSFEEARVFVHSLKLKSNKEWREYCKLGKKPDNIPYHPERTYKDWKGWGDWLGTMNVFKKDFISFEEARKFVRKLKLRSHEEWRKYSKSDKKSNIPATPNKSYKNKGWKGWGDWLGIGNLRPEDRVYLSFKESRSFVRKLKLKSIKEWRDYCKSNKKPDNIPACPNGVYRGNGWINFGDWLGTGTIATRNRVYLSFRKAKEFVHTLGLKSQKEWFEYTKSDKKPDNIPSAVSRVYKDKGWKGIRDWLGIE